MKQINKLTILTLAMGLLLGLGISESIAQEITLQPNRRENTYKTWNVNGIVDIQIRDVKDRGKALEGKRKIKYRCKKDGEFEYRDIDFSGGHSERMKKLCALIEVTIKELGREIKLRAGAEKNGFTVRKEGGTDILEANNVIDPVTNKPLEGRHRVESSIFPDYVPSSLFGTFREGTSRLNGNSLRRRILSDLGNFNLDIAVVTGIEDFRSKENSSDKKDNAEGSAKSLEDLKKRLAQLARENSPELKAALDKLKEVVDKNKSLSSGKANSKSNGSDSKTNGKSASSSATADSASSAKVGGTPSQPPTRDDAKVGGTKTKTVKTKETVLNKNGKGDNSYRVRPVTRDGDEEEYDVTLERVKDPDTGKVVTGVAYFIYRCADEGTIKRAVKVDFNSLGNGVAKAACAFVGRPFITFGRLFQLTANANINGYSLNGSTVAIRGVVNPENGEKIDEAARFVYSCYGPEGLILLHVILQSGSAEIKAACLNDPILIGNPYLLYVFLPTTLGF